MNEQLKAPFIYFGGKANAAELIWSRLGLDCGNYIEPFFGSGVVLLRRPSEFSGWITVNDLNGHVANFWRSMKAKPELVAEHACNIVNEIELHARHLYLVKHSEELSLCMMADHEFCDPKLAGWWCWGINCWIGGGWCAGDGPWSAIENKEGELIFSQCVNRQLPRLGGGKGVKRQLPHLGGGKGVNRKLPYLGGFGNGCNQKIDGDRLQWLNEWFFELSESLKEARICCGDWSRLMSVGSMTKNGVCGVLLDPPYSQTSAVYASDSSTVAHDVRKWCIENGNDPLLRIALCGHDTEHNELEELGWMGETWDKPSGYQGSDDRERIWFSPNCLKNEQAQQTLGI